MMSVPSCRWGNGVDLWLRDDQSGRQQWKIIQAPVSKADLEASHHGQVYFLQITKGRPRCDRIVTIFPCQIEVTLLISGDTLAETRNLSLKAWVLDLWMIIAPLRHVSMIIL